MKHISTTARIAFSLVCLLLIGKLLGLIPDDRMATMRGRSNLCEAIAINSSLLATKNDVESLEASVRAIALRNPDVLSVGVRRTGGRMLAEIGAAIAGSHSFGFRHHRHLLRGHGRDGTVSQDTKDVSRRSDFPCASRR